jgi:hypothetical protein
MREELQNKLYAEFPVVFREKDLSIYESCMGWGISCGDGWYGLVYKIAQKIQEINVSLPDEDKIVAAQVKEKFGGLRFYINGFREKTRDACKELFEFKGSVEQESFETCEVCGKPGRRSGGGWIKTVCEDHDKKTD